MYLLILFILSSYHAYEVFAILLTLGAHILSLNMDFIIVPVYFRSIFGLLLRRYGIYESLDIHHGRC